MADLKACPFCGDRANVATRHDEDGLFWAYVRCRQCQAETAGLWCHPGNDCPQFYADVRALWNRREPHTEGGE